MTGKQQPNSVRSQIERTDFYKNGTSFTAQTMARHLGVTQRQVSAALIHMRSMGDMVSDMGTWRRPIMHWIQKQRLANTDWLEAIDE